MTNQDAFNNAWRYHVTEGHPPAYDRDRCCYRGPVSNCAIGCQLPDELYSQDMEGLGVDELIEKRPAVAAHFAEAEVDFLRALQSAHDSAAAYERPIEKSYRYVAKEWNLTIPQ